MLHLELGRAAIDDDFVSRAQDCVGRALALNYVAEDVEATGKPRPLDEHLLPLQRALRLKSDIYNGPSRYPAAAFFGYPPKH